MCTDIICNLHSSMDLGPEWVTVIHELQTKRFYWTESGNKKWITRYCMDIKTEDELTMSLIVCDCIIVCARPIVHLCVASTSACSLGVA